MHDFHWFLIQHIVRMKQPVDIIKRPIVNSCSLRVNYRLSSMKHFIIILSLCMLIISCRKDNLLFNQGDFFECHSKIAWDSLNIFDHLIGTWDWRFNSCYFESPTGYQSFDLDKGLYVEFHPDSTLEVNSGTNTTYHSWRVGFNPNNGYFLEIDPHVSQLTGQIFFCRRLVQFNTAIRDGCNNYFLRRE